MKDEICSRVEVAISELGSFHSYVEDVVDYGHGSYMEGNKEEAYNVTKGYAKGKFPYPLLLRNLCVSNRYFQIYLLLWRFIYT